MNRESQLKLQAHLDGELSVTEAGAVEKLLREDAAARAVVAELRQIRSMLRDGELPRPLPESREFYWSKITRHIDSEERRTKPHSPPRLSVWMRALFSPFGAVAMTLAIVLLGGFLYQGPREQSVLQETEADLPESEVFTFHDQQEGMTVVWLSYRE